MKMLGSAVLVMESFVVGFALLIAKSHHGALALALGGALAIFLLLSPGLLRKSYGWVLGSILQIGLIAYGTVVSMMWFLGVLFAGLWAAAFFIGRAGEVKQAQLQDRQ